MPVDDFYWNPLEFESEENAFSSRPYIDPWDLENYAYIKEHLSPTRDNSKSPESYYTSKDQGYADIEELRGNHSTKKYNNYNLYCKLGDEFDEDNIHEENKKRRFYDFKDRYNRTSSMKKERRLSQSYGDLGRQADMYSKLDDVVMNKEFILPIYTENNSKRKFYQPKNFGLSTYGHLKIDYSTSWNNLNKYICN